MKLKFSGLIAKLINLYIYMVPNKSKFSLNLVQGLKHEIQTY